MVVLTYTYLINYLFALITLNKVIENELQIVFVSLFESRLFKTDRVLIKTPSQHRS